MNLGESLSTMRRIILAVRLVATYCIDCRKCMTHDPTGAVEVEVDVGGERQERGGKQLMIWFDPRIDDSKAKRRR